MGRPRVGGWAGGFGAVTPGGLSFHRTGSGLLAPVRSEQHEPAIYTPPPVWENTYSLSFDGSSGEYCYATLDASSPMKTADLSALSVAAWVKVTTASALTHVITSAHSATTVNRYMLLAMNWKQAYVRLKTSTSAWWASSLTTDLNDGDWHHFALAWNNTTLPQIFVDGLLDHEGGLVEGGVFNDAGEELETIEVGRSPEFPTWRLKGFCDEIAWFPGVKLSEDDVAEMFSDGPSDLTDSGSYDTDRSGDLACHYRNGDHTEAAGDDAPYDASGSGNETDLNFAAGMDSSNYVTDTPT